VKALVLAAVLMAEGTPPPAPPPPLGLSRCLPSDAAAAEQLRLAERVQSQYLPGWHGHCLIEWNCWYWRKLRDVHDASRTEKERRESLGELVHWLGWEAVLSGRIPPAVPLELIEIR
jgi:hypothetical protein